MDNMVCSTWWPTLPVEPVPPSFVQLEEVCSLKARQLLQSSIENVGSTALCFHEIVDSLELFRVQICGDRVIMYAFRVASEHYETLVFIWLMR